MEKKLCYVTELKIGGTTTTITINITATPHHQTPARYDSFEGVTLHLPNKNVCIIIIVIIITD